MSTAATRPTRRERDPCSTCAVGTTISNVGMGAHAARRYTTAVAQITLRAAHELATVVGQQPNAKFIEVLALLGPLLGPPASPPARPLDISREEIS